MALARHASTPAAVSSTYATTLVTAQFTPPVGSLLMCVSGYDTQNTNRIETATTDAGSTTAWQRVQMLAVTGGMVAIDWARVTSSVPTRVRSTYDGAQTRCDMFVLVITGQAANPLGASAAVVCGTQQTINWNATQAGSKLVAVYEAWDAGPIPTSSAMTVLASHDPDSLPERYTYAAWLQTGTTPTSGGANTVTFAGTTAGAPLAWVEVVPSTTDSYAGSGGLSGAGALQGVRRVPGAGGTSGAGTVSGAGVQALPAQGVVSGAGALAGGVRTPSLQTMRGLSGVGTLVGYGGSTLEQYVYRPAPPIDRTHRVAWRYIAQNMLTKQFLNWEVPLTTDGPEHALSGPGSLKGTVTPEIGQMLDANTGEPILQEWQTAIYAEADGQIRWGGLVVRSGFSGAAWELECAGFTTYPHGMPYTGPYWARINYDPIQIFYAIWQHLQTQPDGNIGMEYVLPNDCPVRVGTPAAGGYHEYQFGGAWYNAATAPGPIYNAAVSALALPMTATQTNLTVRALQNFGKPPLPFTVRIGSEDLSVTARSGLKFTVVRGLGATNPAAHAAGTEVNYTGTPVRDVDPIEAEPYVLAWWETTDCGQEIDKLAQETPFDYSEEHWWDGATIRHRVRVDYPRLGRRRTDLAFIQGDNITSVVPVTRDGDAFANTVLGIGKGEGAQSLRSEVAHRDGRVRRVAVYTDKAAGTSARLTSLTRSEWGRRQLLPEISSIDVMDHPHARIGSWNLGDDILVRADLPWIGWTEVWCRIVGWQQQGEAKATLTLRRSDSFSYGQAAQTT
jgi:hypothetical protein